MCLEAVSSCFKEAFTFKESILLIFVSRAEVIHNLSSNFFNHIEFGFQILTNYSRGALRTHGAWSWNTWLSCFIKAWLGSSLRSGWGRCSHGREVRYFQSISWITFSIGVKANRDSLAWCHWGEVRQLPGMPKLSFCCIDSKTCWFSGRGSSGLLGLLRTSWGSLACKLRELKLCDWTCNSIFTDIEGLTELRLACVFVFFIFFRVIELRWNHWWGVRHHALFHFVFLV